MRTSNFPKYRKSAHGFTLIECLVYIAILLGVVGLAYLTFYRTRDRARDLGRSADDISRTLHAGERWREDIRLATAKVQVTGTDEEQRLRIPQASGEVNYFFRGHEVLRQAAGEPQPILLKVKSSLMQLDARERVAAWKWELELEGRPDPGRLRPLFSFQAVAAVEQSK